MRQENEKMENDLIVILGPMPTLELISLCLGIQACSPNVLSGIPSLWEISDM